MYSVVLMMAMTAGGDVPDCHRCSGGCAGACHGGGGLFSGCHGGGGGLFHRNRCHGACSGACSGAVACHGAVVAPAGCCGGMAPAPAPKPEKIPLPGGDKKPESVPKPKPVGSLGAPARITVSMPANARFSFDNYTSPAQSETHIIVSAPLGSEETKTYALRAEVARDGKVQTIEKQVTVRSGDQVQVTLELPTTVAAR